MFSKIFAPKSKQLFFIFFIPISIDLADGRQRSRERARARIESLSAMLLLYVSLSHGDCSLLLLLRCVDAHRLSSKFIDLVHRDNRKHDPMRCSFLFMFTLNFVSCPFIAAVGRKRICMQKVFAVAKQQQQQKKYGQRQFTI